MKTALECAREITNVMYGDLEKDSHDVAAIIEAHVQERCAVLVAAVENYEQYLPTSKPEGSARYVGIVVAAEDLRNALAAFKQTSESE